MSLLVASTLGQPLTAPVGWPVQVVRLAPSGSVRSAPISDVTHHHVTEAALWVISMEICLPLPFTTWMVTNSSAWSWSVRVEPDSAGVRPGGAV